VKAGAPPFPVPNFLFATLKDSSSHRPLDTITPLGQALGLKVEMPYDNNDYAKLADHEESAVHRRDPRLPRFCRSWKAAAG